MEAETYLKDSPSDGITCVKYSTTTDELLVSSWDSSIYLYDGYTNALRGKYQNKAAVLSTDFTPDGRGAYVGGLEQKLKKIDFETEEELEIGYHDDAIRKVEYDPISRCVYTGSWDKTLKIWDERSNKEIVRELSDKVYALSVCRNKVVVGMANNKVVVYDTRSSKDLEYEEDTGLGKYQIRCIGAMHSGAGFAAGSIEGRIAIEYFPSDDSSDLSNFSYKCHRVTKKVGDETYSYIYPVNDLSFHPLYNTFASCGSDGMIKTWDPVGRKKLWKKQFDCGITSVCFNKDGSKLACGISYNYDTEELPAVIPEPSICILKISDSNVKPKSK